jgi:hypothetical protein
MNDGNKNVPAKLSANHGYWNRAIAGWATLVIACFTAPLIVAAQDAKPPQSGDGSVRVSVHNVKYRFAENASVQINNLSGAIVPIGQHTIPVFDDKESFKVRIDSAEVAISFYDLANLLNQFVFGRPGSQLSGLSVETTGKGHLKVKGRLKDKGGIPFETDGALVATPDGKLRLHADKVRALKIPVKGLMDALGIEVDNVIKSGKVPGLMADGNDLIFDLEQILPAPHIEGSVKNVRVAPDMIVETLAGSDAKSANGNDAKPMPKYAGNYIALQGGRVEFWKVAFEDCDIIMFDLDPGDPLDLFLDQYKKQVAAGYTKVSEGFQVRTYLKDYGKLAPSKSASTAKNKN